MGAIYLFFISFLCFSAAYADPQNDVTRLNIEHSRSLFLFARGQTETLPCRQFVVAGKSISSQYAACKMHGLFPDGAQSQDSKSPYEVMGSDYEAFLQYYYAGDKGAGIFIDRYIAKIFQGDYFSFCKFFSISCVELKDYYTNPDYKNARQILHLTVH